MIQYHDVGIRPIAANRAPTRPTPPDSVVDIMVVVTTEATDSEAPNSHVIQAIINTLERQRIVPTMSCSLHLSPNIETAMIAAENNQHGGLN